MVEKGLHLFRCAGELDRVWQFKFDLPLFFHRYDFHRKILPPPKISMDLVKTDRLGGGHDPKPGVP